MANEPQKAPEINPHNCHQFSSQGFTTRYEYFNFYLKCLDCGRSIKALRMP
jgi:hypothetical protein